MVIIDESKCNGCGTCAENCPQQAISIVNGLAVIDRERCRECGFCTTVCPSNAITEEATIYSYSPVGKGGRMMMRGRGWFGRGFGIRGGGMGFGMGRGVGFGRGMGMGRGNPYPFCRFYPWLPRRWWSYGAGYYPQSTPAYTPGYAPYRW